MPQHTIVVSSKTGVTAARFSDTLNVIADINEDGIDELDGTDQYISGADLSRIADGGELVRKFRREFATVIVTDHNVVAGTKHSYSFKRNGEYLNVVCALNSDGSVVSEAAIDNRGFIWKGVDGAGREEPLNSYLQCHDFDHDGVDEVVCMARTGTAPELICYSENLKEIEWKFPLTSAIAPTQWGWSKYQSALWRYRADVKFLSPILRTSANTSQIVVMLPQQILGIDGRSGKTNLGMPVIRTRILSLYRERCWRIPKGAF